jgi:hypothetical protein
VSIKFEMAVNARTAKALSLTMPLLIALVADDVIDWFMPRFGRTWLRNFRQCDRNVPCSAGHLRPSIRVFGRIGDVTNERFQNQKELFGKHGFPSIAIA